MSIPLDRVPPHNDEAERGVLTAMLLEPGVIPRVKTIIERGAFYREAHRAIFDALVDVYNRKGDADIILVTDALREQAKLESVGGISYVSELLSAVPTVAHVVDYAQTVRKKAIAREIITVCASAVAEGYEEEGDPTERQAFLEGIASRTKELSLDYARATTKPAKSLREYLDEKYERECKREKGLLGYDLRTFKRIARTLDGIQPGFYIVGAETNIGKTAFLCTIFLDLLKANEEATGIYFSLDDRKDAIINRLLVNLSSETLTLNEIQRQQEGSTEAERKKTYEKLKDLYDIGRLDIRDTTEIDSVGALEAEVASRAQDNLFVVIDGLYNLDVGIGRSLTIREMNIERANRIKALADVYNIPVLASAELRKKESGKPDREPVIDDLMESSKFAYNANLVWLLYPDNREAFERDADAVVAVELKYAKNKLSSFRATQHLAFTRDEGRMEERS